MRVAWVVAGRELRSRVRDRSAWIVGVVAPVALALIVSFAFGGRDAGFHADVGYVPDEGLVDAFVANALEHPDAAGVWTARPFATAAAAEEALAAGEVAALVEAAEAPLGLNVVRSARAPIAGDALAATARAFAARAGDAVAPIGWTDAPVRVAEGGAAAYFGPAMAMLFVFFTLAAAPRSLLAERRQGTLARVRAAPVSLVAVVAGKALAAAALGFVGMLAVWGVTSWVFGVTWGDPLAVVAVLLAFLTAAAGIATLACAYARSDAEADGLVSSIAFVLAMIGGNFVVLGDMPPALRTVALATPNGQALDAFTTLAADGGGIATIAAPLLGILAFAAGAFALSAPGLRRWVVA
ncbi:MAG: ABC transporter permease [Trueperaceae bacterium]